MLQRISSHELAEWFAYYSIEPWGEQREESQASIISATVPDIVEELAGIEQQVEDDEPATETVEPEPWESQLALVEALNVVYQGADLRTTK